MRGSASRRRVGRGAAGVLEWEGGREGREGGEERREGGYLAGLCGMVLGGSDQLGGIARVVEDGGEVDGGGDVGGGRGGGEDVVGVDGAGCERGGGGCGCGRGGGHCCGG